MDDLKITYEEAFKELSQLLSEMESGEVSLDEITAKVKRAGQLVKFCQARLRNVENDLNALFDEEN